MSTHPHPRRTPAAVVTRSVGHGLSLKTNMVLRKGATFHSPPSPSSSDSDSDSDTFTPPALPRRSLTNLDEVVDAHRRRVALTLDDIDRTFGTSKATSSSSVPQRSFRDDSLSVPQGILANTIMTKTPEADRRVLRPRVNRRPSRYHESDSGLGTSIATSGQKRAADKSADTKGSAITRSAASSAEKLPGLSDRATKRIIEHTLKPLLAKPSLKEFHPVVLACPKKIQRKEIVCLRDLEKTLLLIAPVSELRVDKGVWGVTYRGLCLKERTKVAELYLEFCTTSIRCIQATVQYLNERELTRPSDLAYSAGYFIDLVDQIRHYAQQLADAKDNKAEDDDDDDEMDIDGYASPRALGVRAAADPPSRSDEIKLHGGITINGRPAELVRVKKDGKAFSIATGEPVELDEDTKNAVRVKRSASEELEDQEEIMRSMARRKKNAPPEEYAPKKCGVPGCNKEFKRPCDLTKHEKTHSRPWKCPIPSCKYHEFGWPTEKERDRHQNDKHSSNPMMYKCHFGSCQYKSKRESNCKQHMEKAHNWTYVRTKTNGKNRPSNANSPALPTPQLQSVSTPGTAPSLGVATPPQDQFLSLYPNIEFPAYIPDQDFGSLDLPREIHLDISPEYSPLDNPTPSTDATGLDHNSAYQDMGGDFTLYEDMYSANARLPTPMHHAYGKEMMPDFASFSAAEMCQPLPAAHISPTGQGSAMLFTPASLADVDEGFEDFPGAVGGADFILFPSTTSKPVPFDALFDEIPSVAAGFSQPNSQNVPLMDWQPDYHGFSQH